MEIIVEVVAHFVLLALNVTLGLGLAIGTYWLWLTVRRRVWGLDRAVVAETPAGELYSLEVPGLRVRTPVSRRIFMARASRESSPPEWSESDRLHPNRVAATADDLLIFVVPFLFVGVIVLVLVFVLEFLLALIVLGLVSVVATMIRHRFTCVVTGPDGGEFEVKARGLRQVRRVRGEIADALRAGDLSVLDSAGLRGQDSVPPRRRF